MGGFSGVCPTPGAGCPLFEGSVLCGCDHLWHTCSCSACNCVTDCCNGPYSPPLDADADFTQCK